MQQRMTESGELPPGINLVAPSDYSGMSGRGEFWVSEAGLPLRQILHLQLPDRPDDFRVEADITVDFSNFAGPGRQFASLDQGILASSLLAGLRPGAQGLERAGILLAALAFTGLIVAFRRSRKFYAALVAALIFALVFVPLLQSQQVAAFYDRHAEDQATQAERNREAEWQEQITNSLAPKAFDSSVNRPRPSRRRRCPIPCFPMPNLRPLSRCLPSPSLSTTAPAATATA